MTEETHTDEQANKKSRVQLAVFDFDGTSISGNSPVLLVRYLHQRRLLKHFTVFKIMLWATAYKLRLPQKETWVRSLVFTAFQGKPQDECDRLMGDFFDERIAQLFRADAEEAMQAHLQAGRVVVVISATFEPIVVRAAQFHPFNHQVATKMRVDDAGRYTCEVDGAPVEGLEKVRAIQRFADAHYGKGNWELAFAYGDHHSDRPLLFAARHAFAVTPDCPLKRTAVKENWEILKWA
ncbi:MAG: HAD-IB family hydrolase [Eggerthellaceae bacterium]|jgi:HAD superfamily hydrolase (TIGR01490 family)|nr:HAD-IB family hydrolase [Eggerthellaceae bacterium]MDR2721600.1 HAD-IB family hydrolase [Coriobacteriaceae bacterium]